MKLIRYFDRLCYRDFCSQVSMGCSWRINRPGYRISLSRVCSNDRARFYSNIRSVYYEPHVWCNEKKCDNTQPAIGVPADLSAKNDGHSGTCFISTTVAGCDHAGDNPILNQMVASKN